MDLVRMERDIRVLAALSLGRVRMAKGDCGGEERGF